MTTTACESWDSPSLETLGVVTIVLLFCLSTLAVGFVGASAASPGTDVAAGGDVSGLDSNSTASLQTATETDPAQKLTASASPKADESVGSDSNSSGAVGAAVSHVQAYESEGIPPLTVVESRADLVSQTDRTADVNLSAVTEGLSEGAISAPKIVDQSGAESVVRLYTWSSETGLLLEWDLTVADGAVIHRRATAERVGLGTTVNHEEFAPSEGTTVINDPLGSHGPPYDAGNLSISNNYVTVFEDGSAESTTIKLSDFGPGNEQVDVNVSIEGTRIQNRSGNQLELSTDDNGNGSVVFVPPSSLYSGRTCVNATSSSTSLEWCITDPNPGDDNVTMDDASGLLTIEEARSDTASGGGETITYVVQYTDQNLDSVIDGDPNRSKTEADRQEIVDAALDAVTAANEKQIGTLGFDEYLGEQFEADKRIPVNINDGTWKFHGARRTLAIPGGTNNGFSPKSITWNPKIGYGDNVTRHARHILAHEHFHIIQFSYRYYGTNNGGKWYLEGMARFMETLADPDVVNDSRSLFFASSRNGVNGYLDDPNRPNIGNYTYDYAIFWLYLQNEGGIDAIEDALYELNNVSGSGDVDDWGPKALDRVISEDSDIPQDSFREFMLDFHVDVYRATDGDNPSPFTTNRNWAEHMQRLDAEDYVTLDPTFDVEEVTADVGSWSADYVEFQVFYRGDSADGLYIETNRSDLYTRTVRLAPESVPRSTNPSVVRGNLSASTADTHPPVPNNTVYGGTIYEEVGVFVMSLGDGKKSYKITGRANLTAHRLNNSLDERDERAVYLIPVNQPKPPGVAGGYGSNGDLFVSVTGGASPANPQTGGPRDLTANLTLAAGQPSSTTVREPPTPAWSNKSEFVAPVDDSESSVWKLNITEESFTPSDPGDLNIYSNYLDGGPNDGIDEDQLIGMPTNIDLEFEDLQMGSGVFPDQISFVVNVDNGDNTYQHSPFPDPDSSHFRVEIGGVQIPHSRMTVSTLDDGKYHLTVTPPKNLFSPGEHQLCAAFEDTKFGVTEVTSSTCGGPVLVPVNPPGGGSSIVFDPPTIDILDPTQVFETTVSTAHENDTISLVHTNADGEGSTTALTTTRVGGQREGLRGAISETIGTLDPASTQTDIAAGLEGSLNQLQEADLDAPRAAILVSPGRSNSDVEAVVDEYVDEEIPIHVVAVGDDPNEAFLSGIAKRTGGVYLEATSVEELHGAVGRIDRLIGYESVLYSEQSTVKVSGNSTITSSFAVDETADPFVARTVLSGGLPDNATVRLFNPAGEEVGAAARLSATTVFRVSDPPTGTWSYEVQTSSDGAEGTISTSITSHSQTSLRVATDKGVAGWQTIRDEPMRYTPGATVGVDAALVGPDGGLGDAEVTGILVTPDGGQQPVVFESRGNGSYETTLPMTEEISAEVRGTYAMLVVAQQGDVVRRQTLAWQVQDPPVVPELRIEDGSVAPGEKTQTDVVLDTVPNGLQELQATACAFGDTDQGSITDGGPETVTDVSSALGSVTVLDQGNYCLTFRVDETTQVEAGAENVTVATLTVSESVPGTASLTFSTGPVRAIDADGDPYPIETAAGSLTVDPIATETVNVTLDGAPDGVSAYDIGVSVAGETPDGLGPIIDIEGNAAAGEWLDEYDVDAGGVGEQSVRISATDVQNETHATDDPLDLFELTFATDGSDMSLGEVLELDVHSLRNDNGTVDWSNPVGDPIDRDRLLVGGDATGLTPPDVSVTGDSVSEGSVATVSATFTDEGTEDTHTAEIDWDDGSVVEVPVDQGAGEGSLTADHEYLDDGEYEAEVTVTDDGGASGTATTTVTVSNVAPTLSASIEQAGGSTVTLSATIEDPGTEDTQELVIDWGDGTTSSVTVTESAEVRTVTREHTYEEPGTYEVIATVSDGDGGEDEWTGTASVGDSAGVVVALEPTAAEVTPGSVRDLGLVVEGADEGVSSYRLAIDSSNPDVLSLVDYELAGEPGVADVELSEDGSTLELDVELDEPPEDSGDVRVATITVAGVEEGTPALGVSVDEVTDATESTSPYEVADTIGADVTVSVEVGPPPVSGDDPPLDTDGDTLYEDLNGDSEFTLGDVSQLFQDRDADVVEQNAEFFDFSGETPDEVTISDIQFMFELLVEQDESTGESLGVAGQSVVSPELFAALLTDG